MKLYEFVIRFEKWTVCQRHATPALGQDKWADVMQRIIKFYKKNFVEIKAEYTEQIEACDD